MNKKILKIALTAALAVGCAATACFAGCGDKGVWEATSYYGKTVTFTGKDFRRGFEEKGAWDNYGGLGETTHKKIAETYWSDIDWAASAPTALFSTPPANIDALKAIVENYHHYEKWDGLSFTVTKEDTATITLNLPSGFSGFNLGTSVTMPLYEDNAKLSADYSDVYASDLQAGYHGVGVKADGNKRIVLDVWMSYSLGKNTVRFELRSEQKNEYDSFDVIQKVSTTDASIDLISKGTDNGDGTSSTDNILNISYYAEVTIEDKK